MQSESFKTILYLVRHGQTDYNASQRFQGRGIDAGLNELGSRQAEGVAQYFQKYKLKVNRLYCSSLKRTSETAAPLAQANELPIMSSKHLDEMDFGALECDYVADHLPYLRELQDLWKSGQTIIPVRDGEHPEQVYSRANGFVKKIILGLGEPQGSKLERIVLVVHGRLIRILLSVWLGYGLSKMDVIEHSNGAIYEIGWNGQEFIPLQLHITEHLS